MKVYIPVSIDVKPKEDGEYLVKFKGVPSYESIEFENKVWRTNYPTVLDHYLRPVDLSDLLAEAIEWGIAIGRDGEEYNETKIFNSIIEKFVSPQTTKTT